MTISRPVIGATIGAGLVLLVAGAVWAAPRLIVPRLAAASPGCLYSVRTSVPAVALTIDDTPDAATTARLRELLARHRARATFFVITGQMPGNEQVIRDLVADGHELGNHLTRDEPSIRLSPAAFESSLDEAGRVLSPYAPVRWMRPGGGLYDSAMVATAVRHGYRCALGSVYPLDAAIPSVGFATRFILAHARPGAVIILHDRGARGERTIRTLERVLPVLEARGLRVVTLSEMVSLPGNADGRSR